MKDGIKKITNNKRKDEKDNDWVYHVFDSDTRFCTAGNAGGSGRSAD
jgi:hypothetical protein